MRRARTLLLIALLFLGAAGWVRLLLELDRVRRHERMLMQHAGGFVNHEQRLQSMERALGISPQAPRRPTFGDLICSEAAQKDRPMLGSRQ